jgi:hypothetical protein
MNTWSSDSSVGVAADRRGGVRILAGRRFVSSPQHSDRLWGQPSLLSKGFLWWGEGLKRPGRQTDQSPATSAEVKKYGALHPRHHTSN